MSAQAALRPRRLAGLVAIAEHGDLDRAARALQTTPRALRRSLRDLERDAGEPLISGAERATRLTVSGRRVARSARGLLDALERFQAAATAGAGTVRVAHVAHAGTLSAILDGAAGATVDERVMADDEQPRAVAAHRLDVAVCTSDAELPAGLETCDLRADPFVAINACGPVDPRATPVLAAAYGAAWPQLDAALEAYERELGIGFDRAATPTGCGRELAALVRQAHGRPVIVARSTLDGTGLRHHPLTPPAPPLRWRLVWRRDERDPAVLALVAGAQRMRWE